MNKPTKEQLIEIEKIEHESFPTPWEFQELEAMNYDEDDKYTFYICETDDETMKIAGYLLVLEVEEVFEIIRVAVLPKYRGKGFGNILMEKAIADITEKNGKTILLEVRESNTRAISLYKKYKFENIAVRKKYYADNGENAIVMKLEV